MGEPDIVIPPDLTDALAKAIGELPGAMSVQAAGQTQALMKAVGELPAPQVTATIDTGPLAQALTQAAGEIVQAVNAQKPPVVKNEINLPRVKRQRSKVIREAQTDLIDGQITEFDYEEPA